MIFLFFTCVFQPNNMSIQQFFIDECVVWWFVASCMIRVRSAQRPKRIRGKVGERGSDIIVVFIGLYVRVRGVEQKEIWQAAEKAAPPTYKTITTLFSYTSFQPTFTIQLSFSAPILSTYSFKYNKPSI